MTESTAKRGKHRPQALAERVYHQLKSDIFEFRLMPGDRFSESEIAERMDVSRTPVRQALFWLEHEGYVEVWFRSGWQVRPFDFAYFEDLYDLRIVLECEALRRLCTHSAASLRTELRDLIAFWIDAPRLAEGQAVSPWDEAFHTRLVALAGNAEMTRIHAELSEKIRIIRRLDFTKGPRVEATYHEHAHILHALLQHDVEEAQRILIQHIAESKAEVRNITLHMLQQARHNTTEIQ